MKKSTRFKDDRNQYCKDLVPPQIDPYIQSNPNPIPMGVFMEFDKVFLKFTWKKKMYKNRRG